jgi:glycine/D-amino acid oxidase-like deaminating enzyme
MAGPALVMRASQDIIYAFGHGHIGLVGSARTGRLVAQLLSRREPEIPLQPFKIVLNQEAEALMAIRPQVIAL